ncbi:MAG: TetR/AcrR family transcriptional regulator [Deltaproteobacteria bacterium]|nr:TetR/AcrR family transcriptional regulator [Deltaproteobacteria bacterium]
MKDKKLSRREKEKLRQRQEMLAAALELFSEKGYHNVSMHEIAEKAEFAIGTLYKFFQNKEDLYKALMMEKAKEYHGVLMSVLDKEEDLLAVVEDFIATKARLFSESLAELRLYFAETRGASFNIKAGLDQDIRKLYDKFVMRLASVLEAGVRKKVFRKIDPYYMAVALEGLTNAFLFCWLENPEQHPYEANVPLIRDMFLKGILAE